MPTVYIVSDGRGETAAAVLRAAAVQYGNRRYRTIVRPAVRTAKQVERIVREAARAKAVVFYTLVEDDTRLAIRRAADELLVPTVDILGPALRALNDQFKSRPGSTPGLLYQLDRVRFDRMSAVDYTLKHDDGQRPHELRHADVVLVGVSRASKSSTCFFLAYRGLRAANVPIVPGIPVPKQLVALPKRKVIGLRVNVERLLTVREVRAQGWGTTDALDAYLDRRAVAREILEANRIMERHGWKTIDASYMAVEEIAAEVMRRIRPSSYAE